MQQNVWNSSQIILHLSSHFLSQYNASPFVSNKDVILCLVKINTHGIKFPASLMSVLWHTTIMLLPRSPLGTAPTNLWLFSAELFLNVIVVIHPSRQHCKYSWDGTYIFHISSPNLSQKCVISSLLKAETLFKLVISALHLETITKPCTQSVPAVLLLSSKLFLVLLISTHFVNKFTLEHSIHSKYSKTSRLTCSAN